MRFDRPWLLLLIPVGGTIIGLIAARGRHTVPDRQHRWAVVARLLAVTLLPKARRNRTEIFQEQ